MEEKVLQLEKVLEALSMKNAQLEKDMKIMKDVKAENNQFEKAFHASIQVPLPKPINMKEGDIKQNVNFFKIAWENYMLGTGLRHAAEDVKISILLFAIGEDCVKIYNNLKLNNEDKSSCKKVLEKIEENLVPRIHKRYERAIFNTAIQNENETIDQFVNRLRELVKNCGYGELENEYISDRLVVSVRNKNLRKQLWQMKDDDDLVKIINVCRLCEQTEQQLNDLDNPESVKKIIVKKENYKRNRENYIDNKKKNRFAYKSNTTNDSKDNKYIENCYRCGKNHPIKQCPAWKHRCKLCGINNHFEIKCRKSKNKNVNIIRGSDCESDVSEI